MTGYQKIKKSLDYYSSMFFIYEKFVYHILNMDFADMKEVRDAALAASGDVCVLQFELLRLERGQEV